MGSSESQILDDGALSTDLAVTRTLIPSTTTWDELLYIVDTKYHFLSQVLRLLVAKKAYLLFISWFSVPINPNLIPASSNGLK